MEYLRMLRDAEAPFLQAMPQIKAEVEHILTADPRYVAHEYFTAHWEAFYFTKVAGDLARFGLKFVGCMPVSFNYGAFCLPEKLHDFFMTSKDRLAFETHKDFVLNTHFRRDVFCLGSSPGNPGPEARLDKVVVGSFRAGQGFDKEFQVGATNTVRLNGTVFDALAELLAGKALPVAAVLRHESLREFQQVQILEALECLLASEQVLPFAQGEVPRPTGLSALNRHLLQRDLGTSATVSLACEAAGTAVSLPQIDALMIWAIHEAGLEGAGAWMETWCQERQLQLNDAENLPSMQDLVRTNVHRLPLTLLGVVGH